MIEATTTPVIVEPLTIHDRIRQHAEKTGVSYQQLDALIKCETAGTYDPEIRGQWRYNYSVPEKGIYYGEQEKSYGLAQIHLPSWPSVSYEQATDIDFSLSFITDHWDQRFQMWNCLK